ncbi:GntR family transcriptional regulator [Methylobacterium nodulans]|uniref:Transcriptional regulator, GntR family n=1 Tax=Methylobacterium nodulans (strain LMG 21967 / CNCM I-2342 / ORS 2060) TaxID=460265 RepID=B8IWP6_METNO|nr:GntR family transcriptional regulator [Methylobacterium nodulans]ACL62937.1 transcriptional regulator, GntR family [Methylobacterium nodulans ORS 2060]
MRAGLHERAAERLRNMIVRGDLAPGAALIEVELSEMLGISRTPIREAIKLLAQQGLVELRANRSPCVRPLRVAEIRELFEALAGIERIAAEFAAMRITEAELKRLHELQAEIVREHKAGRRDSYSAANRTIHRTIVLAARNAPLAEAHAALLSRAEQVRVFALGLEDRWEQSILEHQAILDALETRDSGQAGRLLQEHVGQTADVVAASLAGRNSPTSSAA